MSISFFIFSLASHLIIFLFPTEDAKTTNKNPNTLSESWLLQLEQMKNTKSIIFLLLLSSHIDNNIIQPIRELGGCDGEWRGGAATRSDNRLSLSSTYNI